MSKLVMNNDEILRAIETALKARGYPLRPNTTLRIRVYVDGGLLLAPRGATITFQLFDEGDHHGEGIYR